MRSKLLIGFVLAGIIVLATTTASGMFTTKKAALVYLQQPTQVAGAIVSGTVIFSHDEERMARGEPCTTVYQYQRGGQGKKLVEFMCVPRDADRADRFTARCTRTLTGPSVMNEYQFAGDTEAHGVPWR